MYITLIFRLAMAMAGTKNESGESSSTPNKSSTSPDGHHARPHEHEHAPHHLKYGEVKMSGFMPPDAMSDVASDVDDPCHGTVNRVEQRRKMTRDRLREQLDAEARRIHAQRRYLFRRPRPLQYFRGKVLVRESTERGSGRLELFFDLTFVGIIAVLAQQAVAEPTGPGFVRYLITYTAAYMIWHWMREVFDSFYKDDLSQRLLVLFVMAALVIFGNNAVNVQEQTARTTTIVSYLVAEASIYFTWMLYSFYIKAYRIQIRAHTMIWLITVGLMIGAIFVSIRAAIALAVVAMVLEWHAWIFVYSPIFKKMLRLRYSSAIAIEHEIDRYQDFFTIVMGEFVYSLFDGRPAGTGFHVKAGKAIMALIIAFCFQLMYMNGAWSKRITHPLRHSVKHAMGFFTLHLPIVSSLTLCGDALADFIKEERVPSGVRYLACESYAVGTIMLWCLAMLEHERDEPGELWLPKWARLTPRLISGLIAIFLPLTYQSPGEEEATAETVVHLAKRALTTLAEVAGEAAGASAESSAEGSSHLINEAGFHHGADITTGKLLGILTVLSFFTLLWETITSLDGPNAPHDRASEDIIERAERNNGIVTALSTAKWKGEYWRELWLVVVLLLTFLSYRLPSIL
jgi:low temperature requirement protein LtrA